MSRKGYVSRAAIPPEVMARLNAGQEEPQTLAEWLAADPSMNVREIAWSSYRPFIAEALDQTLELLADWVHDADPNLRRCAIESTRPRGVWCAHLDALKTDPQRALPLLEAVRADPARYVQLSVANWLNDASKHRPDWVRETTTRWLDESPTEPTRWIVNHALRTLRKASPAGEAPVVPDASLSSRRSRTRPSGQ